MEEIIRIWKECGVQEAEFHFDCGGDSMNETHWVFLDSKGKHMDSPNISGVGIESQLEHEVYDRIRFYEASDGHYLGESGTVNVTLNDEENDFDMYKSSTEQWSETLSFDEEIDISEELGRLLHKKVARIVSVDGWSMRRGLGETERDYKDDCIISDREEELIVEFESRLITMATTDPYVCTLDRARELICEDDIECANEDADRWEFNADLQGWSDESTFTKASVIFRNEFYVSKPSNN
jgi:hypothetical protein